MEMPNSLILLKHQRGILNQVSFIARMNYGDDLNGKWFASKERLTNDILFTLNRDDFRNSRNNNSYVK